MKNIILRCLILLICVQINNIVFAYDFEVDGIYYNNISNKQGNKVEVTNYSDSYNSRIKYSDTIIIPENINYGNREYSVTGIGDNAFRYCEDLLLVIIPNTVTNIGEESFKSCYGLISLDIPNSVTSIGESAFSGCRSLTSLAIPNSILSIGKSVFYNCSGLTSVDIPNSVLSIGESAFSGCSGLTSVDIPNSVLSIGRTAFSGCIGLTEVTIPNSVTSIGEVAFYGCEKLVEVFFNVENCIEAGNSSYPVFLNCTSLKKVSFGNGVKNIPDFVFYGCSNLTSIVIPDGVMSVGSFAFEVCKGLTEVHIGKSVKNIGRGAFGGIARLAKIYSLNPIPPTCADETVFSGVNKDKCAVYVPIGTSEDYKLTYVWWDFNNIIEKDLSSVEENVIEETDVIVRDGDIIINANNEIFVEVYTLNGSLVFRGNDKFISNLSSGIYVVKLNNKSYKVKIW